MTRRMRPLMALFAGVALAACSNAGEDREADVAPTTSAATTPSEDSLTPTPAPPRADPATGETEPVLTAVETFFDAFGSDDLPTMQNHSSGIIGEYVQMLIVLDHVDPPGGPPPEYTVTDPLTVEQFDGSTATVAGTVEATWADDPEAITYDRFELVREEDAWQLVMMQRDGVPFTELLLTGDRMGDVVAVTDGMHVAMLGAFITYNGQLLVLVDARNDAERPGALFIHETSVVYSETGRQFESQYAAGPTRPVQPGATASYFAMFPEGGQAIGGFRFTTHITDDPSRLYRDSPSVTLEAPPFGS